MVSDEVLKLKKQIEGFLESRFFYAAEDLYKRILAIDPDDMEAHIGILMCKASVTNKEDLIRFYQERYQNIEVDKKHACGKDIEYIDNLCNTYFVDGYLNKDEIERLCRYDLSFNSSLSCRIRQKYDISSEIEADEHLLWLKRNDPAFINLIIEAYDKRINDAKREDELNQALVKKEYESFLEDTREKVKVLYSKAHERRDQDLNALAARYEKSQDIEELNRLIKELESFGNYQDVDQYIALCHKKIEILTEKKNSRPSVVQIEKLLSYARDALNESRYTDAYDAYMDVSLAYPDNERAHLGLLEAKHRVKNDGELFDYYKNLYNEDLKETIQACKEDKTHIEEMARKYMIPGYLGKEEILGGYLFDLTCESSLKHRIKEQKQFMEEVSSDASFRFLEVNGSDKIKEEIAGVYKAYQDRIDEAKEEENRNREEVSNAYHRFLFSAYASLRNKYEDALKRKDEDYQRLVLAINQADNERKLNELILDLQELGEYKEVQKYISLCKKKIASIKEKEEEIRTQKELEEKLNKARKELRDGNYSAAWRLFSNILSDYDDPYAYLGLVMAQNGLKDEEKLSTYYKFLFSEVRTEILEACKEDSDHINEVCARYEIPGYLDKEKIRAYYHIDRGFASETSNRLEQKRQIEEEFMMNPYLSKARQYGDDHIKRLFDDILVAYDERIREAQRTDELKKSSICDIYRYYLKESDRTIKELYDRKLKEKENDKEASYRENVRVFNSVSSIEELKELIDRFDEDYKDSNYYISVCSERIKKFEAQQLQSDFTYNRETGIRHLKEGRYKDAEESFLYCLKQEPENEEIRLSYLMAKNSVHSVQELFEHYKVLYSDEIPILKEAVKEDLEHIEQIAQKFYTIPGYIEKDLIRERYRFDRTYLSLSDCRIRQKKQIEDLVHGDPSLSWLFTNGSVSIKEKLSDLINTYDKRIKEAEKSDLEKITLIRNEYASFLKEKDDEINVVYQGLIQKKSSKKPKNEKQSIKKEESIPAVKIEKGSIPKEKAKTPHKTNSKMISGIIISVCAVFLFIAGTFYYLNNHKENRDYEKAIGLSDEGRYDEAIVIFEQLGDYKESVYYLKEATYKKAEQFYNEGKYYEAISLFRNLRFDDSDDRVKTIQKELLNKAKAGDHVFIGSYEQDGNTENGKEPIEWIVLENQSGKVLLLSRYGLDKQVFIEKGEDIDWENSFLRAWLNETLINEAFNKDELNEILQTTILDALHTEKETDYDEIVPDEKPSNPLQKTRDRIFILSGQELEFYLPSNDARKCEAVPCLKDSLSNDVWWLRSQGDENGGLIQVVSGKDGSIKSIDAKEAAIVRPAIWVKTY